MKMETKNEVSFNVSRAESLVINAIAVRASKLAAKNGFKYPVLDADMDLTACHANGNPLRLGPLLKADDGNFGHDVFGIMRHIDRETGKLGGFFSPRFSRKSPSVR